MYLHKFSFAMLASLEPWLLQAQLIKFNCCRFRHSSFCFINCSFSRFEHYIISCFTKFVTQNLLDAEWFDCVIVIGSLNNNPSRHYGISTRGSATTLLHTPSYAVSNGGHKSLRQAKLVQRYTHAWHSQLYVGVLPSVLDRMWPRMMQRAAGSMGNLNVMKACGNQPLTSAKLHWK